MIAASGCDVDEEMDGRMEKPEGCVAVGVAAAAGELSNLCVEMW